MRGVQAGLIAMTALFAAPASAQDFYAGKTIDIIVGAPPAAATTSTRAQSRGILPAIFPATPRSSSRTCRAPAAPGGLAHHATIAPRDGTVDRAR